MAVVPKAVLLDAGRIRLRTIHKLLTDVRKRERRRSERSAGGDFRSAASVTPAAQCFRAKIPTAQQDRRQVVRISDVRGSEYVCQRAVAGGECVHSLSDLGILYEGRSMMRFSAGVDQERALAAPVFMDLACANSVHVVGGVRPGKGDP